MTNIDNSAGSSGSEADNKQIESAIYAGLGRSGHSGLRGVSVHVEADRIVLSGTVPSYFMKQAAQEAARHACPHRRVYNELDVVQPA